jgi:hypothetical protein
MPRVEPTPEMLAMPVWIPLAEIALETCGVISSTSHRPRVEIRKSV